MKILIFDRFIMRLFSVVTTKLTLILLLFLTVYTSLSQASLPDLEANKDERSLSNPSYVLGQYWFRKLNGSRALIDFPPAYDYFKDTLALLLPQTDLYNKKVELTFLNSSQSNAFVIPGNHMFLYSDIMEMITNEDMLLGLLAHELAHLDLKHYERQTQRSNEEMQKTLTMLGAGIAAALAGAGGDTTSALWLGGIANQAENKLTYSRQQEQEADRRGRDYLQQADLNPNGMTQLFQAFFKKALGRPKLEFLSTHPSPESRMSDTFSITTKETLLHQKDNTEFEFFRASLLAYRAGLEERPYLYLTQQIHHTDAGYFAKALFAYLVQSPKRALTYLQQIEIQNRYSQYLLALSLAASEQIDSAIQVTEKALNLAPKNIYFSMLNAQLTQTQPKKLKAEYLYQKRALWRANIQFYQSINNKSMPLYYRALLDFNRGKEKTAKILLNRAIKNAKNQELDLLKSTDKKFNNIISAEKVENLKEEKS
ncbi:M48 family metalloprotease [Marinomonas sp. THO17]|uniref:M48 family metallopeptidase n=1 Tax=Marinomonas sp. THO17 TaxID=3149048 RepID=UPI00336BEF6D